MKRFLAALLFSIVGFFVCAIVGYFLVSFLSSNSHDREVEAAMTSIFVAGPIGGMIGAIAGVVSKSSKKS